MRFLPLLILVCLAGCVQARIEAYYHPKPPEPCQVPIIVEGEQRDCVSYAHASEILRRVTP